MLIFVILFGIAFAAIAWRNITHAIVLFFFLLPTYLIRFSIGPIPSTLLELMFAILFVVVVKDDCGALLKSSKSLFKQNRLLKIGILLFLLGATISVFTAVDVKAALGEWKAFYIEPAIFFLLLAFLLHKGTLTRKHIIVPLLALGTLTGLLAIYQHTTGWFVPQAFWANGDSFRVTAWYGYPNGVGIFLGMLMPLAIAAIAWWKNERHIVALAVTTLVAGLLGIVFAKSTGALVGLVGTTGLLLLFHRKSRLPAIIAGFIGIILLFTVPQLTPIKTEILAQDRSGQIRIAMWSEAMQLIADRPIFGAGLASYDDRIIPYHKTVNNEGIEIFHHPHNVFLTMYVNLGLIGFAGFIIILIAMFRTGTIKQNQYLYAAFTIVLIMGLVDSPYIKNDLAMLFWTLPAMLKA